ncbi:uncharacterized protein LOC143542654 [Bidens hawaiensis]|uniref:uncharacterized protein LOC143542654 n=1 Tax=Bidens hawaiensis TaxID=980011 RepID=UPI00404A20A5
MSFERSFDAWEEVQRHGLDLADRLTQGFAGLIQSHNINIIHPSFNWPNPNAHRLFEVEKNANGVFMDIGNKLGQAGENLNGYVKELVRRLPVQPFRHEVLRLDAGVNRVSDVQVGEDVGVLTKRIQESGFDEAGKMEEIDEEAGLGFSEKLARFAGESQGVFNISSTSDSRTRNVEGSLVARGDFWRVEASRGGSASTSANENPSLFLVQLGPLLFVRDSTLLLPLHLSKQHLLWYGYDRKNGMHSVCPAVWSQHRRWLLMSMICLNPLACVSTKIPLSSIFFFNLVC